jgi:ATP-binding cassette subfamily F protein 3
MGKSTFIKSIVKDISYNGNIQLGHQVMMGYFAQDEAHKLDPKKTVFETIDDVATGEVRKNIRQILGSFLFSGDDTEKKVQVLSGGEKTRLSLCKLLLQPNNFLILDEPTNHLDMKSKEILKDALAGYAGTLLLVSHDRGFLDGLTDRVYFIKDKTIKVYHEPVTQFINSYYNDINSDTKAAKKPEKKNSKKNKKHQNQQKSLERKITKLEEKQTSLEFELYETTDAEKLKEIQEQLTKLKKEIEVNFESLMAIGN